MFRLGEPSLSFAVDHFLRTWKPSAIQKTVETAFAEFLAAKEARKLRADSMRNLRGRTKGLLAAHGPALVNEITAANIAALINKPGWSAQQSSNERRVLTDLRIRVPDFHHEFNQVADKVTHEKRHDTGQVTAFDETILRANEVVCSLPVGFFSAGYCRLTRGSSSETFTWRDFSMMSPE